MTEKHEKECAHVVEKTKQKTTKLNSRLNRMKNYSAEKVAEILVSEEKTTSTKEKVESTAETLADSKELHNEVAGLNISSQDAQDLLQGANCLKKCG